VYVTVVAGTPTIGLTGLDAAQLIPFTPATLQLPRPVGAGPEVGPATVAVKVKVEPSTTLVALVVTVTTGINFVTATWKVLLGPAAR